MIRVCIAGITGWVGVPLAKPIRASEDLELAAAIRRVASIRGVVRGFDTLL